MVHKRQKISRGLILSSLILSWQVSAGPLDDIVKPTETDSKPNVPVPPPAPTPPPSVPQKDEGVMMFGARLVSNMENGFHITDHGYKAICVDSQGVVAQAKMDIYAVVNGERSDKDSEMGYTAVNLRPTLEYLRSGATSGSCNLKVCMPKGENAPGTDFSCDEKVKNASVTGGDSERPTELKASNINYSVSGKDISLKTNFPLVSAFHPVFGFAAPEKAFKDYQSPLVINLSSSSKLDLIDVWDGKKEVRFDLVADGAPVRTGWIGKNAAFLALDINKNGIIDNGLELFGEYTDGAKAKDDGKKWDNGFLALAQHDLNKDGVIDSKDEIFANLVLWSDKNADGVTQASELRSLKRAKIKSISLAYTQNLVNGEFEKVEGNEVRLNSSVTMADGSKKTVSDVWFKQRRFADRPVAFTKSTK